MILAIETSCDDTCAAVLSSDGVIRSNIIASQAKLHDRYGGVVPEVASRQHLHLMNATVDTALRDAGKTLDGIELVAVTQGPGLIGALLVGISAAKSIAASKELPLTTVDHILGHIAASSLLDEPAETPFLCLIASGGHTIIAAVEDYSSYRTLGRTLDDAAGEAFDKGARLLGLPYPGGAELDILATKGDPEAFDFPVGMARPGVLDFSYSGLKTALVYKVRELGPEKTREKRADLAASYQEAICKQLIAKCKAAIELTGYETLAIGGGVAANSALRYKIQRLTEKLGVRMAVPPQQLCTDNAAMIAGAARFLDRVDYPQYLEFDAFAQNEAD